MTYWFKLYINFRSATRQVTWSKISIQNPHHLLYGSIMILCDINDRIVYRHCYSCAAVKPMAARKKL